MCDTLHDNLVLKRILIIMYALACVIALIIPAIIGPKQYPNGERDFEKTENETFLFTTPQSLAFIYNELDKFVERNPEEASTYYLNVNTTYGNQIKVIRLHHGKIEDSKKVVMVIAAMDPSAWYTAMACLSIISGLLEDCHYTVPLLTDLTWIIVPVANPDGYEFNMMPVFQPDMRSPLEEWHKNRKDLFLSADCVGVNLDRNFPFHYGEDVYTGRRLPGCSPHYPGDWPLSEIESDALSKLVEGQLDKLKLFLYLTGNEITARISHPWSFTLARPYDVKHLNEWAKTASQRVRQFTNAEFLVMQSGHGEKGSGTLTDYVMGYLGITNTFTVEARGMSHPVKGMDITAVIKQVQAVIMTLGREYNEKGSSGRPRPASVCELLLLPGLVMVVVQSTRRGDE